MSELSPGSIDAWCMVAGEELRLLPERAAFWPARRTLLVADVHLGKAAAFRAGGIPVPRGTTRETLARLATAVARTGAERVLLLGDLLHAREGRDPETLAEVARWRRAHAALEIVLVRGNHDRRAGDPPTELAVDCCDAPRLEPPFVFAHHPGTAAGGYVLAGHVHPGAVLRGPGGMAARLPCFWFGARGGVLPAFGAFTGLARVVPESGDRVFAVAGAEVVAIGAVPAL